MNSEALYVPQQIIDWAAERTRLRAEKNWEQADVLRDRIAAAGYVMRDGAEGVAFERPAIESAEKVKSQLESDATLAWSVVILARDRDDDLRRAVESAAHNGDADNMEIIVVGNGESATHNLMADLAVEHAAVRPLYVSDNLGEGPSLHAALRAATSERILIMGVHIELTGDAFAPLAATLADEAVGVAGGWGSVTEDLFEYSSSQGPELDAVEFYLFAFRRKLLSEVGLPDERFKFYRNLDMDWSLAFKDKGYRLLLIADLPAKLHEHIWERIDPEEGARLSKKNYGYLLEKWRGRTDLLVSNG